MKIGDMKLDGNEDDFHFEVVNPAETGESKENVEVPSRIERRYHPTYIAKGFKEYGENWQTQSYRMD